MRYLSEVLGGLPAEMTRDEEIGGEGVARDMEGVSFNGGKHGGSGGSDVRSAGAECDQQNLSHFPGYFLVPSPHSTGGSREKISGEIGGVGTLVVTRTWRIEAGGSRDAQRGGGTGSHDRASSHSPWLSRSGLML